MLEKLRDRDDIGFIILRKIGILVTLVILVVEMSGRVEERCGGGIEEISYGD